MSKSPNASLLLYRDCPIIKDLDLKDRLYELFEARKVDTDEWNEVKGRYLTACHEFSEHMGGHCNAK